MDITQSEVRVIVWGVLLVTFLAALDQTIIATAVPTIARDLGDVSLISWIISAYLLTSTCITPIIGKLSDLYGRRWTLIACLALFMIGSAACALAEAMIPLIIARAVQGVGGGGLVTLGQAVIADIVTPRERARYSAQFSTIYASASVLGPTLGGVLTEYWGWPWIFWINLPLGAVALLIAYRALRKLPPRQRGLSIDYAGILTLSTATVALLMVLSLGGKKLPWTSPTTIGLLAVTVILTVAFARIQVQASEPILPPRFLGNRVLRPLLSSSFIVVGVYLTINVLAPVYFQVALGTSVTTAGLLTIPLLLSSSFTSIAAMRYARRSGRYKRPALYSLPIAVVATACLGWFADRISPATAAILLTVIGFGIGPLFPISSVAAMNAVDRRDFGAASGALIFARALGSAIAIAAASALVLGLAAEALPDAAGGLEELVRYPLSPEARLIVAHAFAVMFDASAFAMLIGIALFYFVEDRVLRDKEDTPPPRGE
jgi:EmrB/QacA subfamily drug resistance transporter